MMKRLAILVGLLVLCAWAIVRVAVPPRPVPATAPDTAFSAERALRHVEAIAARPHAIGMEDHDRVRDYILAELTALGLRPQVQTTTAVGGRYRAAGRVQNILAWIPGNDSKGRALLLVAHYDGVEAGPSAADDAAGVAAILETVRALRARQTPLAHDVIVLITDGEEVGLLGAAAFVREHPWAKDVAAALNFEARGTTGRSFMFETMPGDRAIVSALAKVRGVTAGSVFTTVYRALPNDTDLSEIAALGVPALNFAFADGVERYHTSNDDVAHLDPGSVQHHGDQMLGLVRVLANGPLPLPATGDAIFFDLPFVGLVVYPMSFAVPLAIAAFLLGVVAAVRHRRGVAVGIVVSIAAITVSAFGAPLLSRLFVALHAALPWDGSPQWSGVYGAVLALIAVALTLAWCALSKRWSDVRGLHVGAVIVWGVLALVVALRAPGASYLFAWPALIGAIAALLPLAERLLQQPSRAAVVAQWLTAAVSAFLVVSLAYGVGVVMLGLAGPGAIALGVLVSLVALINLPLLDAALGDRRLGGAAWLALAAVVLLVIGAFVVRRSDASPERTSLAYAQHADSSDAWFGSFAQFRGPWTRAVLGATTDVPNWTSRIAGAVFVGRKVERVPLDAPSAELVRDTLSNGARRVVLRIRAPKGAVSLRLRAIGADVSSASIDGRVIDTTRFRYPTRDWTTEYWAVPDSGAIVALSIPRDRTLDLEMTARSPGIPAIPGVTIPARPRDVVPAQAGDASYVYRRVRF